MKRSAGNHSRKDPGPLIDKIFHALAQQTVTVPGAEAVEIVIPRVAAQIKELKQQRDIVAGEVENWSMTSLFPRSGGTSRAKRGGTSMPGVGVKTAAQILLAAGD